MTTRPLDPIAMESALPGLRPSSPAWRATVKAMYGTPLTADEAAMLATLTDNVPPPAGGAADVLVVAGRRGGKSETMARVGVFECIFGGHEVAAAPGQKLRVVVVSPLREQSGEILSYAKGIAAMPAIRRRVVGTTADSIEFRNGLVLQTMTCDAIAVSGPTVVTVLADEFAKWPGPESSTPDTAILASLRPAMAPVRGAPPRRFIGITSAYLTEGVAYETDMDCHGKPGAHTFVVKGPTTTFNPNVDRDWLARERRRDGKAFAREYLCQWQDAITEGWFGDEVIDRCVDAGRGSSGPVPGLEYVAAIDAAFKSDAFTVAIAHRERRAVQDVTVLDMVAGWRAPMLGTLPVEHTVSKVAAALRRYGLDQVLADQFCAAPLAEAFARHGVTMVETPWTAQSKPVRFRRVRDAMIDALVRLPDDPDTVSEFRNVAGRMTRSGGEQIEARRGHDDRVSASVLAMSEAMDRAALSAGNEYGSLSASGRWDGDESTERDFMYAPRRSE